MWKKLGMTLIALLSTFSVVYAMNRNMQASMKGTRASSQVAGTLKLKSGVYNLANYKTDIPKLQRVYIGEYNGTPIAWDVVKTGINKDGVSGSILMSTNAVDSLPFSYYSDYVKNGLGSYTKMNEALLDLEKNILHNNASQSMQGYIFMPSETDYPTPTSVWGLTDIRQAIIYPYKIYTNGSCMGAYTCVETMNLWSNITTILPPTTKVNFLGFYAYPENVIATNSSPESVNVSIRPWTFMDDSKVVFALEHGDYTGGGSVAVNENLNSPMKLRVSDNGLKVSLNESSVHLGRKAEQQSILINYSNATVGENQYISALITDSANNLVSYQMIEKAKLGGNNVVSIDTTNLKVANGYKLHLVNEVVSANVRPTTSSALTPPASFDIVPAALAEHSIAYNATPSIQSTYEYDKNVSEGNKIGVITRTNGIVPIHYEIVSDGDSTYQNFEIVGLDVNGDSSDTLLDVKVKSSGAPDIVSTTSSLKAGTYKFCIESTDANGDPITQVAGQSKVCASLTVDKTTPTISFTTPAQTDMKIGDTKYIDSVSTSNKDTLNPGDITYALGSGVSGVLTASGDASNPLGYEVSIVNSHSGLSLPTTFNLEATISETVNYLSATTTVNKPIYAYKELSALEWSANKSNYYNSDVTSGSVIGTLLGKDGSGPFKYEMTTSTDPGFVPCDNTSFAIVGGSSIVAGTKVNVKTTTSLAIGTYNIQFKVTDAKGKVAYTKAVITVSARTQSVVDFKEGIGGSIITNSGITMKFNDTSKSLYAEGGSTSLPIEYFVAAQADQPGGIEPSLYLGVHKTNGALTPIKVGKVRVFAQRPADSTYATKNSDFMEVTIEKALQSITFNNTTNPIKVGIGKTITEDASGKVTLENTVGIGGIMYKSSDSTIASIDASGKVTGMKAGTVTITAILNDPSSSAYNPNYETVDCQKTINVYAAMTLNWSAKTPNLKAESSKTGDSVGSVSATGNSGSVTYNVSTDTGIAENADGALFTIMPTGNVQLKNKITAAALDAHGSNTYKIRLEATDSNGTTTIDITITIDDAINTPHFTDSSGNVITSINEVYGENSNTFQLYSTTSNGISAVYQLDPSDTSGTIGVNGLGHVTVNKVGTGSAQLVASAGTGYDGATLNIPVTITQGNQSIAFVDTSTLNRQFVANSTFNDPANLTETSANTSSSRTITYSSDTPSICSIDAIGTITMNAKGSCIVMAENKETNWQPVTTTKTINLFTGMGVTFTQSNTPQAETASAQVGSPVGGLTVNGGSGPKSYAKVTANTPQNKDARFFTINNSGVISFDNAISASDIASSYDSVKQAYILYVQFETTDNNSGSKVITDAEVKIKGAPLNAKFDRVVNGKITQTYSPNGTFTVQLSSNVGNGQETYRLKNDPTQPSDVIQSVQANGLVKIDNANDRTANPKPVMIEAIIPASNGYDSETIEVEVEIIKANQPGFGFTSTTMQMPINSTLTPVITRQLSTGTITLTSMDPTALLVNGNDIVSNTIEDTVTIIVSDTGDRNYNIASGQATVTISSAPAYPFTISVPPATYGDTGLKATIVTNGGGANKQQTWVSSDPTIADVDVSGNLTIYNAGKVSITCTQDTTGEPNVSSTAVFTIKPKPITITINDKSKYVGEAVPGFDMTIPNGVLVSGDTISLPNFSCLDTANTPVTITTPAGSYPITGSYTTGANPNYAITVTQGTLTVKQDASQASWYHLEGVTSGNTLDSTKWYNEDVKVVLDTTSETAGTYDEISLDQSLWDATSITVTQEDENSEDVYFRINASGILSTNQSTTIKIDKTNPIVKSITGTQTNKDASSTLINNLTFGIFFKPGTLVSIKSEDVLPSPNVKVSGLQEVTYEVYEIDPITGIINSTPLDAGINTPDGNGNIKVKLDNVGLYRVCAIAKDNAGNVSGESCSDVNIKKIDVDIDNDGENEFQDIDNDGCPDINIALQDEKSAIYKINVDRDDDGIPDLNIDSDGDGIAEINVDTDDDGRPDLNLVILTKWEPTFCAKEQSDYEGNPIEYCTMKDIKPLINVDTGKDNAGSPPDGIPDINIDTGDDMKADINIDRNGDGKLDVYDLSLTGEMKAWVPKTDYTYKEFLYDTQSDLKPKINIRTTEEMKPDLNIDTDGDGLPDINIDINGDGIPETNIDSTGDGEPDFNLDPDRTGTPQSNIIKISEWKPNVDGEIDGVSFKTMDGLKMNDTLVDDASGIQIQKPGGSFLPNYSIKVNDIKDTVDPINKGKIEVYIKGDTEIKGIYDVKLSDGTTTLQPDGSVKVRIPVSDEVKDTGTVKVVIEQADGSYKEVNATIKDGYIEYETDYLGKVGIIADISVSEDPSPDPEKPDIEIPNFTPNGTGGSTPGTMVKGDYTSGIGGAGTGDISNKNLFALSIITSISMMSFLLCKRRKEE